MKIFHLWGKSDFFFGMDAEKIENCETHFPSTGEIPQV